MDVPENWIELELKSHDSYVGGIRTSAGDTIFFDYGKDTYPMDYAIKVNDIKEYQKLDSIGFEMDRLIFSKYPHIDQNQGTFHKEYYYYDSIGSYVPKIRVPKKAGNGSTAIYFDSLQNGKSLYLSGINLGEDEQRMLLKSFSTIKIN
ncbi:MAG: hypothetical protein AAGD88_18195 [Bacteroidota bacterium]